MAGKAKRKIDYAGWSVDIFDSDTKIDKLLDAQGWVGFSIYFYLCQRAFGGEGYFYQWGFDDCASTARKMGCGIGSGTIREVVGYCLQIDLFSKRVFDRWGVITSRGIQRSFWAVASGRRDRTVYKELWLLQKEECKSAVFVPFFTDMSATDGHSQATDGDMSDTNDPVVKGSKVKSNKEKKDGVAPPTEPTTFLPESFEMQCVEKLIRSVLDQMPNAKVPATASGKQKWAVEMERMQRLDHRSQKQISQALDYAINNRFWKSNIRSAEKFREKFETLYLQSTEKPPVGQKPKNQFHNFDQRETDYDALMLSKVQERLREEAGEDEGTT